MRNLELIGGPLDGAMAEDDESLREGDNVLVEGDNGELAVYTLHLGLLEFNAPITFGT
jgi:hypothetical protein